MNKDGDIKAAHTKYWEDDGWKKWDPSKAMGKNVGANLFTELGAEEQKLVKDWRKKFERRRSGQFGNPEEKVGNQCCCRFDEVLGTGTATVRTRGGSGVWGSLTW